jgi:hypothetical protein
MKNILIVLLLPLSSNIFADWTKVGDGNNATAYVDFQTIKKKRKKVIIWSMLDFKVAQKDVGTDNDNVKYLSTMSRDEHDCEEGTIRILDIYSFSGNMRKGDVIFSLSNVKDKPESILPGSLTEKLFKAACSSK